MTAAIVGVASSKDFGIRRKTFAQFISGSIQEAFRGFRGHIELGGDFTVAVILALKFNGGTLSISKSGDGISNQPGNFRPLERPRGHVGLIGRMMQRFRLIGAVEQRQGP